MRLLEVFQQIDETSRAPLWHAMKFDKALIALGKNRIYGFTMQRYWPDGRRRTEHEPDYRGSPWLKGISTTRDPRFAMNWGDVVLKLNPEVIARTNKIIPYSWGYHMTRRLKNDLPNHKKEREEFIVTGKIGGVETEGGPVSFNRWHDRAVGSIDLSQALEGFWIESYVFNKIKDRRWRTNVQVLTEHPKFMGIYDRDTKKFIPKEQLASPESKIQMAAESLTERREAPLYHWMDTAKIIVSFGNDNLDAQTKQYDPLTKKLMLGNSMTRNKHYIHAQSVLRLTINTALLERTHKIVPLDGQYAFWNKEQWAGEQSEILDIRDRTNLEDPDELQDLALDTLAEEFVIGNIPRLHRYITRIDFGPVSPKLHKLIMTYAKQYGIPYTTYENYYSFNQPQKSMAAESLNEVHYTDLYPKSFEAFRKKYLKLSREKGYFPSDLYVQFSNHKDNTLDRTMYDSPDHTDPMGIYTYPLEYVVKYPADIWYGAGARYLRVIRETAKNPLYLKHIGASEYSTILYRMGLDGSEKHLRWVKRQNKHKGKYAALMTFMSAFQVDYSKSPTEERWGRMVYPMRSAKEQNQLLLRAGYDCLIDTGTGAINDREPLQAIFLTRASFRVEEVVTLRAPNGEDPNDVHMTINRPERDSKLQRRFAQSIAASMGDTLSSDRAERSNLNGWGFFWTKAGRRIEINFTLPSNYYDDLKVGEKKHKRDKLSTDHRVQVIVQTEFGPIETREHDPKEKLDTIASRIGARFAHAQKSNSLSDWQHETQASFLVKQQRAREKYLIDKGREEHGLDPITWEQYEEMKAQGLNYLGIPFEEAKRQYDQQQLDIINRALKAEGKPLWTMADYVKRLEND